MANYASNSLILEIDATVGGALSVITQYIRTFNGIDIEPIFDEDAMSYGDTWPEVIDTTLRKAAPVVLGGAYNDGVTPAPDVIFYNAGAYMGGIKSFKVTWGGSKTTAFEVGLGKYRRVADRGKLHMFEITLHPTGAVTEA